MRRVVLAVSALVLVAAGAAPADAALKWGRCPAAQAFECAVLRVPLDHSGKVPGTIPLHIARTRRGTHARVLVALSGGPGQSAVPDADFTADALSSARSRYAIVTIDQRGTGDSAPLSCPALQRIAALNAETAERVRDCANRIGPKRAFFSTVDSVADLEDLRRALHVPKLALQGISYGTFVAQQYARIHPDRTDRLILDSVVGKQSVDTLLRDTYAAIPRLVREQCQNGACRGITDDPLGDIRTLAARIENRPLSGKVVDQRGRGHTVKLGATGLAAMLMSGDLNPHLQAALPAAVRSAVEGDYTPILSLVQPSVGPPLRLRELSEGLNIATTCDDIKLSFPIDSPVAGRRDQMLAAVAAVPPDQLGPFSRRLTADFSVDEECLLYPPTVTTAPSTAPLPDVPALVLSGRQDWRTPLENGQAVAAEMPRAQFVTVPGTGHDELDSDLSGCVDRALRRFFANRRVGDPCKGHSNQVPPQAKAPKRLARLTPAPGTAGTRGKVLRAAVGALNSARETSWQLGDAGFAARAAGGLRGGRWHLAGETTFVLSRVEWAPGVRITGRVQSVLGRYRGTLRVSAPQGMGGTLRLDRRRGVNGTLGGKRVHLAERYVRGAVQRSLAGFTGLT